jgi:non-heme chloroperoxidase
MHFKPGRTVTAIFFLALLLPVAAGADGRWTDRKIKVGDIKIHYIEAGTGDRTIVFLTGWTMPAEIWQEQIPYFTTRGFRVIAFDPRSQGDTSDTETGNTYQQHAADLYAFLLAVKAEHSFLVGWSSGVTTLLEYVSSPDSIRPNKIILVDGFPAALKEDDYPGVETMAQARSRFYKLQENREKFTEKLIQDMFKQPQSASLLKDLKKSSMKTSMGAVMSLFFDLVTGNRLPALYRISVPTLVITTRENQAIGEFMKSKISRSELTVIDDAGHAIFLDKPQAFNQALEDFIGEKE